MRKMFAALLLLCVFFACGLSISSAQQTQINPATQVRWPAVTGIGPPMAPTRVCSAANLGQPYTDSATGLDYKCTSLGYVLTGGLTAAPTAANQFPLSTAAGVYGLGLFPTCANDGTHALTYNSSTFSIVCSTITAGSGSVVASPQFQKAYYNTAGTLSSVKGDTGATTDGAGNETAVGLKAFNPLLSLGTGAITATASDYATFLPMSVGGVTVTSGGTYTAGVVPTVTFSAPGGGGATATGVAVMNAAGTAVAFVHLTGIGNLYLAAPTITFSPAGATATATIGRYFNGSFPLGLPWQLTQTVNRRFGPAGGYNPLSISLNLLSGTDNTNVVEGNYSGLTVTTKALSPLQGGGAFSVNANCFAVGDCVGQVMNVTGRGVSRGEDEGTEYPRYFIQAQNDVAGGVLASISTDAQGANPISVGIVANPFSFNFYEKSFIVDVTQKFVSPGNIASIGTATDRRFEFFQGDATSGITAQFGVSTQTALTAPVDSFVYIGACGAKTATTTQFPVSGPSTLSNDGFMTNYKGVGAQGENTNYDTSSGALTGYCATVGSTAGMSPGTLIFLADGDYQVEYTKVISVVDATHFTAFFRQPHSTGATVNFGGAVGYGIGADIDITPPGTNSTIGSAQVSTQRLVYPIVQSLAGDQVIVYTNIEGSSNDNLRTLLPQANTPKVPLTITAPVVTGGVLTGFTANNVVGNANDYTGNNTGASNSGHPKNLPAPIVTVSGCTVPPIIKMQAVVLTPSSTLVTYSPVISSGGSGCPSTPTFNIPSFYPTPFGIYPMAMVYKSEDPTVAAGMQGDGKVVFMPFNTSTMSVGDTIQTVDWWNGGGVGGQISYNGNYLNALNGRNGDELVYGFTGVGGGFSMLSFRNLEPSAHYYGSFANNYTKTLPSDSLLSPPVGFNLLGQLGGGFVMGFPPLVQQAGSFAGGAVITVNCAAGVLQTQPIDPPCLHGINTQYDVFRGLPAVGQGGVTTGIFSNPATGGMGVDNGTVSWQAPSIVAYSPLKQTTVDALLVGAVNDGVGTGPCVRFDLLLTTTGAPFGGQSDGRICSWQDHNGSTLGDISFQTNNGGGPQTYSTPLLLNSTAATFNTATTVAAKGTATSTANFNSNTLNLVGSFWNGTAAASDTWTLSDSIGLGISTLSFGHVGLGSANVGLPNVLATSLLVQAAGSAGVTVTNAGITTTDSGGATNFSLGTGAEPAVLRMGVVGTDPTLGITGANIGGANVGGAQTWSIDNATGNTLLAATTVSSLSITSHFVNTAAFQIVTGTLCPIAAGIGNTCIMTFTLGVTEPVTTYNVTGCQVNGTTTGTAVPSNWGGPTTTGFALGIVNMSSTAAVAGGTVSCQVTLN